jgi:hypothetical protein
LEEPATFIFDVQEKSGSWMSYIEKEEELGIGGTRGLATVIKNEQ